MWDDWIKIRPKPERGFDLVTLWTISFWDVDFYDACWEEKLIKTVAKNNLKLITRADAEQEESRA